MVIGKHHIIEKNYVIYILQLNPGASMIQQQPVNLKIYLEKGFIS